jgi:NADPH-dependent 2,4-dienoyl-CoA reductase/sulfur reductase-like enzyme
MPRVAVVGAGGAGIEAARVAASNGARVFLLEARDRIPSPKSSWPTLLDAGNHRRASRTEAALNSAGVEVLLNHPVSEVGEDSSVAVAGHKTKYDAIVLSTGSAALTERLEGIRKPGVHVLDSEAAFAELGRKLGGCSKAIIEGSGPVAVRVAEKLRSRHVEVLMLASRGLLPVLNVAPRNLVMEEISSWGVQVMEARPDRVVGVDRVEAVVASGDVVPGDCFVVVPKTVPCVPELHVALGRSGGVVVDEWTQSSRQSIYAAGDCAEVGVGNTTMSVMFESSARLMGAVAGANASGRRASASVVGSFFMELARVGVASAGVGLTESAGLGLDVVESSKTWKGELACSLVYDRQSRTVLGAQLAGRGIAAMAASLPIIVAAKLTVDHLAYTETIASSDISPIEETAREGALKR